MVEDLPTMDRGNRGFLPPPTNGKSAKSISPEVPPASTRHVNSHRQQDGIDARLQNASTKPGHSTSRSFGVHSILNPTQGEEDTARRRRRSAAQMEEGGSFNSDMTSPNSQTLSRPSSRGSDIYGAISPTEGQPPRLAGPRRILTPLSPTMQRSASMGRIIPGPISTGTAPTGTIDAHQSPFLSDARGAARVHTALPGAPGIPALPSFPPPELAHRYPPPPSATPPIMQHAETRRPSVASSIHSARASPAPSFPLGPRSGLPSPSIPYASSASVTPSFGRSPSLGPVRDMSVDADGLTMPGPLTNLSSYQLMTVDTVNGPVQVPVEVQAASRMADEKRKRNAGASARFRARRKEKEKESSSRITNLEQQLHDALTDLNFFRKEREDLLDALRQLPGGERYLTREKTPPVRRYIAPDSPPLAPPPSAAPTQSSFMFERPGEGERSTRRRTESYSLPPTPGILPPQSPGYFAQSPYQRSAEVTRESTPMQGVASLAQGGPRDRPQPLQPVHNGPSGSFTSSFDERWSTRSNGSQR